MSRKKINLYLENTPFICENCSCTMTLPESGIHDQSTIPVEMVFENFRKVSGDE